MKPGRRPDSARGSVSPGGGVGPPASDGLEVFFMRPFLNRASAPRKRLRGAEEDALGTQGGGCPPEQRLPAWLWYFLCYPAPLQKPCQVEVRGNKAGRGPAGPQKRTCRHHAGGPCSLIAAGPSGRNDPRRVNVFLLDRPRNGLPPSSQGRPGHATGVPGVRVLPRRGPGTGFGPRAAGGKDDHPVIALHQEGNPRVFGANRSRFCVPRRLAPVGSCRAAAKSCLQAGRSRPKTRQGDP